MAEAGNGIAFFLRLERKVWQALVSGDMAADAALLEEGFLGVYETGFADRAAHFGQLARGPSVARFTLHEPQLLALGTGLVLLAYRAEYVRVGATDDDAEGMYVSSIWRAHGQRWRNIFSQDTPEGTRAPV